MYNDIYVCTMYYHFPEAAAPRGEEAHVFLQV